MGGLQAYLEAVLGVAILGGVIWFAAVLLRRFLRLDTASAVLLSIVFVPAHLVGAFYLLTLLD
jgi:hypothetical protein